MTVNAEPAANDPFAGAVNVRVNVACVPVTTELGVIVNVPVPEAARALTVTVGLVVIPVRVPPDP